MLFELRRNRLNFSRSARSLWSVVLISVTAFLLASACALPGEECKRGTTRCNFGNVEMCDPHGGGYYGNGGGGVTHVKRSSNTWDSVGSCGGADLCVSPEQDVAFCVLEHETSRVCPATGTSTVCDGTTRVECHDGFIVKSEACAACDAVKHECVGGIYATCTVDTDCAHAMTCRRTSGTGTCEMACACAEGAACASCDLLDRETQDPQHGTAFTWVCRAGACFQKY